MPGWQGSTRRSRLPANWDAIRVDVLDRDGHRCTADDSGARCPSTDGLEVDHIERGDNHVLSNLRTLCRFHHGAKTAQEGLAALAAKRAGINQKFRRSDPRPSL